MRAAHRMQGYVFKVLAPAGILTFTTLNSIAEDAFLLARDVVRAIADGRPWKGAAADGPSVRITLNKDGTGTFEGPLTMTISWQIKGEDFCIDVRIGGTKCLRFKPAAGGYEGYAGNKLDLTLKR